VTGGRQLSAAVLWLLTGCGNGPQSRSGPNLGDAAAPAGAGVESSVADSLDRWNKGEVIKRLAEAGLVVADSGSARPFVPLTRDGDRLLVSGSELLLYVYPDAAARATASAALDTAAPELGYAAEWRTRPRVILVNNLIALHFTPNDRLAERVDNVLRARHLGP
jgi:hypothetical protein